VIPVGRDKKYALLDTDFLYKSHLARNKDDHTLTDFVIDFEDYEFFCHEMIKEELTRHEVDPDPNPWLQKKIADGRIKLYSDRDIVKELSRLYGMAAIDMYLTLLEISCEIFHAGFFEKYYGSMRAIGNSENIDPFLTALKACDDRIPHRNGIGEKKTYVLIQMMEIIYGNQVYVFCSDDFKARQSIASLTEPVNCISILGVFHKLMKMGHEKCEMQEYYNSLSGFLKNQTEFKVWASSGHQRLGVPIRTVFDEIYAGKFRLLRNGDLQYIE
jgi:hypothetical protein